MTESLIISTDLISHILRQFSLYRIKRILRAEPAIISRIDCDLFARLFAAQKITRAWCQWRPRIRIPPEYVDRFAIMLGFTNSLIDNDDGEPIYSEEHCLYPPGKYYKLQFIYKRIHEMPMAPNSNTLPVFLSVLDESEGRRSRKVWYNYLLHKKFYDHMLKQGMTTAEPIMPRRNFFDWKVIRYIIPALEYSRSLGPVMIHDFSCRIVIRIAPGVDPKTVFKQVLPIKQYSYTTNGHRTEDIENNINATVMGFKPYDYLTNNFRQVINFDEGGEFWGMSTDHIYDPKKNHQWFVSTRMDIFPVVVFMGPNNGKLETDEYKLFNECLIVNNHDMHALKSKETKYYFDSNSTVKFTF